ncbi:MAG: 4-alpha-glucanotransferase [Chloroflexi bacterium]|nr:4-alpha-glucanotransferase [Chloroflexota bacterium]
MKFERASGVILHPTSLPGEFGIGDLGVAARRWVDFLDRAGCAWWQVLPLGPTGYGDSPYQCFSAFAGNPYLISPEDMLQDGLLSQEEVKDHPRFPDERVDFGAVIPWKLALLDRAYHRFEEGAAAALRPAFEQFRQAEADWLEDFALFMALKEHHGGAPWVEWPAALRDRQPDALAALRAEMGSAVERQAFRQFLFFRQWSAIREYARERGIRLIGDIPIFVAHDSADVWVHRPLFYLDAEGQRSVMAGVPPDYFSATGQLWGNPLYRWGIHREDSYAWWLGRLRAVLKLVDVVRLDHFRGFSGYWEVPGGAKTAQKGRWVKAPGADFFRAVAEALGDLPIIAEDLGVITPDVRALRDSNGLPGMKILQFAFGGEPTDPFLPHNYPVNCVTYTGTHDNDTARGWYERVGEDERSWCRRYLKSDGRDISWDMIRACWSSVAVFSIAPMQDLLSLGNDARMNYPGNPSGNWSWRLNAGGLNPMIRDRLREVNYLYSREKPQPGQGLNGSMNSGAQEIKYQEA